MVVVTTVVEDPVPRVKVRVVLEPEIGAAVWAAAAAVPEEARSVFTTSPSVSFPYP
jgi:hypothetical protein